MIYENTKSGEKVALLGLSYKPGTYITEESQSLMLARRLTQAGYDVAVHDPKALQSAETVLSNTVSYFEDPYTCVKDAVAIVLLTDWPLYRELDWKNIGKSAKAGALVLDSWRILKKIGISNLCVVGLGIGLDTGL